MSTLKAVRGTRDLLPPETALWNRVEATARAVFARYGFGEIRTPVFEDTQLFVRGVGEETDVVSKEMYTWEDRARAASEKAQSLTLRPENTAGVVRSYIEHKMGDTGMLQKLFYIGPQFRRERPQRGRYRQFWQIGAEVLGPQSSGAESALRDAEVLEMLATLLDELAIPRASEANDGKGWRLALNSVGSSTDRPRYIAALKAALEPVKATMCVDCQRRAETNPLRVLDCKVPEDQPIIDGLPKIAEYLDEASTAHFAEVKAALDACGVPYVIEPRLVRGLDYYTRTTFEFTVALGLGTQNALLGGGRYDGLSEMLGGPKAPGIGFAIGEDRLILTLQALAEAGSVTIAESKLDAYIAPMGAGQNAAALALAKDLRASGLSVEVGDGSFRLKKSFELADKLARRILILGEDEVATGVMTVKTFATGDQVKVERAELGEFLKN
ncbi:histidyl-tRNA synthetase [Granulicella aggregans]|uniref:Histidine--tRNA ligase n=1 Tax=Granulicella aggregans TaxID=474949 RepID=A0A7W7ZC12_9BACT|nr:histidine--tRNA ligase [Granulicella aggregans]MBB5057053.1 histidyl-tRNA synthetase [Granulicella aggregans]